MAADSRQSRQGAVMPVVSIQSEKKPRHLLADVNPAKDQYDFNDVDEDAKN